MLFKDLIMEQVLAVNWRHEPFYFLNLMRKQTKREQRHIKRDCVTWFKCDLMSPTQLFVLTPLSSLKLLVWLISLKCLVPPPSLLPAFISLILQVFITTLFSDHPDCAGEHPKKMIPLHLNQSVQGWHPQLIVPLTSSAVGVTVQ